MSPHCTESADLRGRGTPRTWWRGCSDRTASETASTRARCRPTQHLPTRNHQVDARNWRRGEGGGERNVPEPMSLIGVVARGAEDPVGIVNSLVRCSSLRAARRSVRSGGAPAEGQRRDAQRRGARAERVHRLGQRLRRDVIVQAVPDLRRLARPALLAGATALPRALPPGSAVPARSAPAAAAAAELHAPLRRGAHGPRLRPQEKPATPSLAYEATARAAICPSAPPKRRYGT